MAMSLTLKRQECLNQKDTCFNLHEQSPYITAKKTRAPYVVKSGQAINNKPSSDKAILLVSRTLTLK